MRFSALLSTTYIKESTLDVMTLSVLGSNIIFQEVDYFENSTMSSSLRGQALYAFRMLHKFQAWKMTVVLVIHFVHKAGLYVSSPAVSRRQVK
jgi:hypothetical protein